MSEKPDLWARVEPGLWRPHPLVAVGGAVAACTAAALLTLLVPLRAHLDAWLLDLRVGGMMGSAKPSDQVLGLAISASFCLMMAVVAAVTLWRARRRVERVRRSLVAGEWEGAEPPQRGDHVVWVYQELSSLPAGVAHVLVFGLSSGAKVRSTVPADAMPQLWSEVQQRFAGVSQGHDAALERSFAVRPALLSQRPRQVEGVQHLDGLTRARG